MRRPVAAAGLPQPASLAEADLAVGRYGRRVTGQHGEEDGVQFQHVEAYLAQQSHGLCAIAASTVPGIADEDGCLCASDDEVEVLERTPSDELLVRGEMDAEPAHVLGEGRLLIRRLHRLQAGRPPVSLRQPRHLAVVGPLPVQRHVFPALRRKEHVPSSMTCGTLSMVSPFADRCLLVVDAFLEAGTVARLGLVHALVRQRHQVCLRAVALQRGHAGRAVDRSKRRLHLLFDAPEHAL